MRIGIDLGGTKIAAIALDDDGRVLQQRRRPTPAGDYAATLEAIRGLVRETETETGAIGTVGIGIPGSLSPATGLIRKLHLAQRPTAAAGPRSPAEAAAAPSQ